MSDAIIRPFIDYSSIADYRVLKKNYKFSTLYLYSIITDFQHVKNSAQHNKNFINFIKKNKL